MFTYQWKYIGIGGTRMGMGKKHNTLVFLLFCIQPQLNSRVTSAGGLKTFQKLFTFYYTRVVFTIYSLGIRSLLSINQDQRSIIQRILGLGKKSWFSNRNAPSIPRVYKTLLLACSDGKAEKKGCSAIFEASAIFGRPLWWVTQPPPPPSLD